MLLTALILRSLTTTLRAWDFGLVSTAWDLAPVSRAWDLAVLSRARDFALLLRRCRGARALATALQT